MKTIFVVEGYPQHPQAFENRADAEELALTLAEESLLNEFNYLMSVYPSIEGRLQRIATMWTDIKQSNRGFQVTEYTLFTND